MFRIFFLLFLISCSFNSYSQWNFAGEVTGQAMASSGEELPFWMYHNTRGRIPEETNFASWVSGVTSYSFNENSVLQLGGGGLVRDGNEDNFFLDEAYFQYNYKWLEVIAGRKQREELYNGLSATNENILWSLNARPLPGVQIKTAVPVFFDEGRELGFLASLGEYLLEEDRHVSRARVHHKRFHLVYRPGMAWKITAGIQHFAQWGGTSATTGPQPEGFNDYLRVFAGREGGENAEGGDQQNVLGNHLGSFELNIKRSFSNFDLEFIYNHIFEDGTGSRYVNFPDGRYGIFVNSREKNRLINSFLYEFYYTKNQSTNTTAPHKNDAYFNNYQTYRSGWTYEQRIIGAPFFTYDPVENRVNNNRFVAHHFGIAGGFPVFSSSLPYRLLLSYVRNEGTVERALRPKEDVIYMNYEMLMYSGYFDVKVNFAADFHSISSPLFGTSLQLRKTF